MHVRIAWCIAPRVSADLEGNMKKQEPARDKKTPNCLKSSHRIGYMLQHVTTNDHIDRVLGKAESARELDTRCFADGTTCFGQIVAYPPAALEEPQVAPHSHAVLKNRIG